MRELEPAWTCRICGERVSQKRQKPAFKIRRPGGWDHIRCALLSDDFAAFCADIEESRGRNRAYMDRLARTDRQERRQALREGNLT